MQTRPRRHTCREPERLLASRQYSLAVRESQQSLTSEQMRLLDGGALILSTSALPQSGEVTCDHEEGAAGVPHVCTAFALRSILAHPDSKGRPLLSPSHVVRVVGGETSARVGEAARASLSMLPKGWKDLSLSSLDGGRLAIDAADAISRPLCLR
jgi:hypothetical protein